MEASKYKALLVDLDDTLTMSSDLYGKAMHFASSFLAQRYSLDADAFYQLASEKYMIVQRNFPTLHTRHSRILVFRMALDEMVGKYDLSLLPEVEDMYWEYFLKNLKLFPGVKDTLESIRNHDIKIAIVSDGSLNLRIKKAKAAGVLHLVDEVIASEEVVFEKPFSAIFTLALSRLQVAPTETVMLGNNFKNDIRGAQLVGIKSGIFDPDQNGNVEGQDGTINPDFVIRVFPELLKVLGLSR